MLTTIKTFFDRQFGDAADLRDDRHTIEVATAALLTEIVRMDGSTRPAEREAVLRAVRGKFGLSPDEAQALIDLAEEEARGATDYYQFTSIINRRFTQAQKVRVVRLLWDVAWADAVASPYEEHLIRKLSDLLYVEHRDYINAKLEARAAAGADAAAPRSPPPA
jgi:uncharacterized tellurite resistance protein B-like protein